MTTKIAHIIIGLNVGGAELMLKRLVLHSSAKGKFEHCVISLTDLGIIGQQLRDAGIEVYSIGMNSFASTSVAFIRLRKLLKKINPDVVQTWMYHADFLGGMAAKSLGIKKIIWGIRTTDVSQGASKMTVHLSKICAKLSYYIPDTIICAAQVSKSYHIDIGYDASKMVVIPNGYDTKTLTATDQDGLALRNEIGLSNSDIVIGSVGRFNPVKNQKFFIDVAAEVIKHYPYVKFIIVGRDNDSENIELMSWINSYGMVENFRLLGQRNDVPRCLKAMDIFCLHSKTEGFPNVVAEALLNDRIVVSTNVGDVKKMLNSDFICNSNSYKCMSNLIIKHINESISNKNIVCTNKSDFCLKFSIENICEEFERFYIGN